jgi:hypothetical protein
VRCDIYIYIYVVRRQMVYKTELKVRIRTAIETITADMLQTFLISNFRLVLKAVCFLFGNSPACEVYIPTFRNTLFHLHKQVGVCRILDTPTCL